MKIKISLICIVVLVFISSCLQSGPMQQELLGPYDVTSFSAIALHHIDDNSTDVIFTDRANMYPKKDDFNVLPDRGVLVATDIGIYFMYWDLGPLEYEITYRKKFTDISKIRRQEHESTIFYKDVDILVITDKKGEESGFYCERIEKAAEIIKEKTNLP